MISKNFQRLFCFSLLFLAFSTCAHRRDYFADPEEQLVHELSSKRVVMLGDFYHEMALPWHGLTSLLSTWVSMLSQHKSDQSHLTLFLEEDSRTADLIRHYLNSGDFKPLLDFILPNTSLERLEFYADLRRICLRIDSLNAAIAAARQITFDVQGPEAGDILDTSTLSLSESEAHEYFLRDRDSLASINIISYLNNHPSQRAIIYYGSGHLIKAKNVPKDLGYPGAPHGNGNFLASYLKEHFGDEAVLSVSQLPASRAQLNLKHYGAHAVLFYSNEVPWQSSPEAFQLMRPDYFDAFLVVDDIMTPIHPLRRIFSKTILSASIARLELTQPHLPNVFAQRLYQQSMQTLRFLSDTSFPSIPEWKRWYSSRRYNPYAIFQSASFRKQVITLLAENPKSAETANTLSALGFSESVANATSLSSQQCNKEFDECLPNIVYLNSIGISWIGSQDERENATQSLARFTGQEYSTPDMYLKWWRKKFYATSY